MRVSPPVADDTDAVEAADLQMLDDLDATWVIGDAGGDPICIAAGQISFA